MDHSLCILWGGVAACMAATSNWKQLAGVRFSLGVIEAGFAPGVAFYLSSWYRRYELASRFAIYYTATAISGAFSGLLAGLIVCLFHRQKQRVLIIARRNIWMDDVDYKAGSGFS